MLYVEDDSNDFQLKEGALHCEVHPLLVVVFL